MRGRRRWLRRWCRAACALAVVLAPAVLAPAAWAARPAPTPSASPGSVVDCLDWQQRQASGSACFDVTPTFACVWNNGDGSYTAALGYVNNSPYTLALQPGTYVNSFYGKHGDPNNWGQPTLYPPGTSTTAFTVTWTQQWPYTIIWQLGSGGHTVAFSSSSTPCTSKPVSLVGSFGAIGAAALLMMVVFGIAMRRAHRRARLS